MKPAPRMAMEYSSSDLPALLIDNLANAVMVQNRNKMVKAGVNPLTIQNYSVLLTTYMNLMDERIPEVAPPGSEKQILKLKKKFGADSDAPYKIAWAQYTKKKG